MANVLFKRGPEANLLALTNYDDGCFYLTSDTHRLYTGVTVDNTVKLEAVNEGVTTVATATDLPELTTDNKKNYQGRFYYITDVNILAVCSGSEWVQINPDTTLVANDTNTTVSSKSNDKKIVISNLVKDSKEHESKGSFTLVESDNVTLSSSDNEITIAAKDTSHTLATQGAASAAGIKLTNDLDSDDVNTINFVTENSTEDLGTLSISNINDEEIKYTLNISNQAPTSLTIQTNSDSNTAGNKTGFDFKIANPYATDISAHFDPTIKIGKTTSQSIAFKDGEAILDVYTAGETDQKITNALTAADAMKFEGVLGTSEGLIDPDLLTGTANAGATYKVGEDGSYFGYTECKAGDLLIAVKDGSKYDASEDWYYIPSGDDQVISGNVGDGASPSIIIKDQSKIIGQMIVEANGSDIEVTSVASKNSDQDADNNVITAKIAHKTYEDATPTADANNNKTVLSDSGVQKSSATFTAITSLDLSNGHITGINTSDFAVTDTHNQITTVNQKAEDITDGVKIFSVINTSDQEEIAVTGLNITSSSLNIVKDTSSDNKMTINLEWGTF